VIVCDVMMPGFDGIELTRRLRANAETAAISLLLLTAKAGSEHAVVGLEAGANDYLEKPFDSSELLARVEGLLAQTRRLRHQLARASTARSLRRHRKLGAAVAPSPRRGRRSEARRQPVRLSTSWPRPCTAIAPRCCAAASSSSE
jgi:DNA-binding response OmpR family regulator